MNQSFTFDRRVFTDPRTGREVWQVTDGDGEHVAPYMEVAKWSRDDRYLFFMGNGSGTWQPYRLELATGKTTQMAQVGNALYRSLMYEPVRDEVYVEDARTYRAIHPETLESRVAVDYRRWFGEGPGHKGSAAVVSGDATRCAWSKQLDDGTHAVILGSTDGSNEFQVLRLRQQEFGVGHLQFNPRDNNYLSGCAGRDLQNDPNECPFLRAREYHIDLRTGEVEPLVLMEPGFRATHCVWGDSGERIYFHRKTVPTWVPTALCSVDKHGRDYRNHYETSEHKLGHCDTDPTETWIVTDSQDLDENILMLAKVDGSAQHMLCWPNMSIGSKRPDKRLPNLPPHTDRHTHPGFSATGKYISYTSDVSGRSQVYVVPVGDLV
jgi:hypothetical protein